MKRKQITSALAVALCVALVSSCALEAELVAPNPGFGIVSTGQDLNGLDYFLPYANTTGQLTSTPITGQVIIPSGATGTRGTFEVQTNLRSRAIVPDGIAPAFWTVRAGVGWNFVTPGMIFTRRIVDCNGRVGFGVMARADFNIWVCTERAGIGGPLPIGIRSLNVSQPGVEFQMAAEHVTTTYGMPTFQFYDPYGTFVAQTGATSIDPEYGIWAKGWTHCLAGLPAGTYTIDMINATADGVGERVGTADVYLYGASSANYIDDHRFFVAQQYRDLLGREPDQAGLDAWTSVITQCSSPSYRQADETYASCVVRQRVNVAHGFWYSSEFAQLHPEVQSGGGFNNSQFARLCHALYLLREPTQADLDFWTAQLDGTGDYDSVVKAFINLDEYRMRFEPPPTPICDPTMEELNSCQQQDGVWDYAGCYCNTWGGPMY